MNSLRYKLVFWALTWITGLLLPLACTQPYSPATYRQVQPEQKYAIICHKGRNTLRVPAEEWPLHREHGDYRGPCRETRPAGEKPQPAGRRSVFRKTDELAAQSARQWEAAQARKEAVRDSLLREAEAEAGKSD